MPNVVGIRFKDSGKIYYFAPIGLPLLAGDSVIVETVRGPELAKVAYEPRSVSDGEIIGELKPVLRRAEDADFERLQALNDRQEEILTRCGEKIAEHNLPMRLIKAEYSFDGSRLTFYFTADKRVDFRLLVRDLARAFKTRIELRQIGPRDEAKLLGGIGPCGRTLCCATFLPDYARVSIKMAKDQDLPLNPSKISGVCGRLLCCLSYEHEQYIQIKNELPRRGAWMQTPDGPGEVVAVNVVRETVTIMLAESGVQEDYKPDVLQAATESVATLARSRNAEGITPAARGHHHGPAEAPARPQREPKHHGERRLLRDEIESSDVLEALALLEDGDWDENRESRGAAPARPAEQRQKAPPPRPRIHETPRQAEGQRPPSGPRQPTDDQQRRPRQAGPTQATRPPEPKQPSTPPTETPNTERPQDDRMLRRRRRR